MKYAVVVSRVIAVMIAAVCFGLLIYFNYVTDVQKLDIKVVSWIILFVFALSLGISALISVYMDKIANDKEMQNMMKSVTMKSDEVVNKIVQLERMYSNISSISASVDESQKNIQENVGGLNFGISGLQESINSMQTQMNKYNKDVNEYFKQFSSTSVQLFSQISQNKGENLVRENGVDLQISDNLKSSEANSSDYFNHYTDINASDEPKIHSEVENNSYNEPIEYDTPVTNNEPTVLDEPVEYDTPVTDNEPVVLGEPVEYDTPVTDNEPTVLGEPIEYDTPASDNEPVVLGEPVDLSEKTILPNDVKNYIAEETKDDVQKSLENIFNDELADTLSGLDIMHDESLDQPKQDEEIDIDDFIQNESSDIIKEETII